MEVIPIEVIQQATLLVSSESKEGAYYRVNLKDKTWTCTCPDFKKRKEECKHINAAKEELA